MSDAVQMTVSASRATLTMDQPKNRNALTPVLLNGLGDGLEAARDDERVRVIVLTNNGPAFCAGADLSGETASETPRFGLEDVLSLIQDSPKPVLAKICGHCMGGGVGLAAGCDLSIADDSVMFGFTEVRIGVAPAIISVVCLPKLRRTDALELFLSGERINAWRAAEVGLINSAVPANELEGTVDDLVSKLCAGGPTALGEAKRLVFDVPGLDRAEAFARTAEMSRRLFESAEAAEGMAAFREKRLPPWVP